MFENVMIYHVGSGKIPLLFLRVFDFWKSEREKFCYICVTKGCIIHSKKCTNIKKYKAYK